MTQRSVAPGAVAAVVVPLGYKRYDAGVIPEDWLVTTVGEVCRIFGRIGFRGYTVNDIVAEGEGAIAINPSNIQGDKVDFTKCTYVSWRKYEESPEIKVNDGDVLLVKTGSTVGKTAVVQHLPERATVNPQVVLLKRIQIDNRFLGYMMGFPIIQNQISAAVVGGALPTLSQKLVARFTLPLPPTKHEERAIAEALSDVDQLLGTLDRLIAKKRAIKQAAMQQLLTRRTRLPGFSGEWETKPFSAVLDRLNAKGCQIQTSEYQAMGRYPIIDQGQVPIVGFSDNDERRFKCPDGGVIVFGDHTCVVKYIDFDFVVGADGTQIIQAKSGQCTRYYAYLLWHRGIQSTGYNRHFKLLREREFLVPQYNEQTAIAAALSDVDAEIDALDRRREKTRVIKQGMMQQLLRGRVRLVRPQVAADA